MLTFLYTADSIWQSLMFCFLCPILPIGSIFLLRKFWPISSRPKFSDIQGHMFGVVGIIYAVLIGAIAVGSWDKFKAAEELTYKEALTSVSIYRSASGLEIHQAKQVKQFIEDYIANVIEKEWPSMKKGIAPDIKESNLYELSNFLTKINAKNTTQLIFLNTLVQETIKLREIRGTRLFISESSLNSILLQFTLVGSFLIILASIFFGTEHSLLSNIIVVSILSLVTGLVLTIVVGLDRPYQGDIVISPKPLETALKFMKLGMY